MSNDGYHTLARAPQVSLLMRVWEPRPDWFRDAVSAALNQMSVDIELIVVDDGSTVPVSDMLAHIDDPRLTIARSAHGGPAAAGNVALELARGGHVRFVDADDYFPPHSTARLLEITEGRDDILSYGAVAVCDARLEPVWQMRSRLCGNAVEAALLARFNVRPGAILWPRSIFALAGGFDPAMPQSSDWDLLLRVLEYVSVRGTRLVVQHYRRHDAAVTSNFETGREMAARVVAKYFARHPEQRGTRLHRRAEAMLEATSARVYATHGQPRRAGAHMVRGLRLDPLCVANELQQARSAVSGRIRRRVGRIAER